MIAWPEVVLTAHYHINEYDNDIYGEGKLAYCIPCMVSI